MDAKVEDSELGVYRPCAYNENGATSEFCTQTSGTLKNAVGKCLSPSCRSPHRLCVACVQQGDEHPLKVLHWHDRFCWFHAEHGQRAHRTPDTPNTAPAITEVARIGRREPPLEAAPRARTTLLSQPSKKTDEPASSDTEEEPMNILTKAHIDALKVLDERELTVMRGLAYGFSDTDISAQVEKLSSRDPKLHAGKLLEVLFEKFDLTDVEKWNERRRLLGKIYIEYDEGVREGKIEGAAPADEETEVDEEVSIGEPQTSGFEEASTSIPLRSEDDEEPEEDDSGEGTYGDRTALIEALAEKISNFEEHWKKLLKYIAGGLSNGEIAEELNLKATYTVANTLHAVYVKLGLKHLAKSEKRDLVAEAYKLYAQIADVEVARIPPETVREAVPEEVEPRPSAQEHAPTLVPAIPPAFRPEEGSRPSRVHEQSNLGTNGEGSVVAFQDPESVAEALVVTAEPDFKGYRSSGFVLEAIVVFPTIPSGFTPPSRYVFVKRKKE